MLTVRLANFGFRFRLRRNTHQSHDITVQSAEGRGGQLCSVLARIQFLWTRWCVSDKRIDQSFSPLVDSSADCSSLHEQVGIHWQSCWVGWSDSICSSISGKRGKKNDKIVISLYIDLVSLGSLQNSSCYIQSTNCSICSKPKFVSNKSPYCSKCFAIFSKFSGRSSPGGGKWWRRWLRDLILICSKEAPLGIFKWRRKWPRRQITKSKCGHGIFSFWKTNCPPRCWTSLSSESV